jgi:hypothetical protein
MLYSGPALRPTDTETRYGMVGSTALPGTRTRRAGPRPFGAEICSRCKCRLRLSEVD